MIKLIYTSIPLHIRGIQVPVVVILAQKFFKHYTVNNKLININVMAEEKKAKKVFTLEEIKFNETNKVMAIVACIPIVGLILLFVEKNDNFVRYMGAQYTILGALQMIISLIPVIGWAISSIIALIAFVLIVVGMVKVSQGERFDVPMVSEWALKLMGSI